MKIDLSQFRQTFLQESAEHVATMESGLLALRSAPEDAEILNAIFRSAHSIKGGAGSFGFESLAHFTHVLENVLERLRSGEVPATSEVVDTLLKCVDILRALLQSGGAGELPRAAQPLLERLGAIGTSRASDTNGPEEQPAAAARMATPEDAGGKLRMLRIEFTPDRELFSSATNPIVLLRNLAAMGRVSVTHLHSTNLPPLDQMDATQCYLAWTIEIATEHTVEELREVFEFVEHLAEISIRSIDEPQPRATDGATPVAARETVQPSLPPGSSVAVPPRSSKKRAQAKLAAGGESSSIRVATEKVDRLIDLVGELVIAHVMTAQMVESFTPDCLPKLRESVASMERNTRELHERVMAIRMLPVGTLFRRYVRTVYDIANSTGKQIDLALSGEETEIDKSMLELLGDPLTHLVRNAADHGIEAPDARQAAGKPAMGTIQLRAFHRAGRVIIEVSDDGAGIDPQRIRAKAVERGLIAAGAQLTDEQLRMLIFEPGFSTRDKISDLSGRGVGMDVVKQNVSALNGTVKVDSTVGRGSTITIELPLTLAILEGLLVRVVDRTLVLPLLSVVETVCPREGQIQRVAEQGEVIVIRSQAIPLLRLTRFLGLKQDRESSAPAPTMGARSLVVVVESGRKKIGLVVDELLGQQQVVVKSLEKHLRKVDGLMGATILGDGHVAPIVDVPMLSNMNVYSLRSKPPSGGEASAPDSYNHVSPIRNEREEHAHAMV